MKSIVRITLALLMLPGGLIVSIVVWAATAEMTFREALAYAYVPVLELLRGDL